MDYIKILEEYGLDNREAKTYIQLLKDGTSTANQISKETKILRQTIYEVLEKLIGKGIITFTIKNKVKFFEAKDPTYLVVLLEEKKEVIENFIPELKSLKNTKQAEERIELFEGISGLKAIYKKIIQDKPKEILEISNSDEFIKTLEFYFVQNYMKKRINKKINLKLITEPGERNKKLYGTNKKEYRETRYNSQIKEIQTATYLYENKVIIISYGEKPKGIILENEKLSKTQEIIFEELWKNSRE